MSDGETPFDFVPPATTSLVRLEVVQFTCPNTHRRVGSARLTFRLDGIWIPECPSCGEQHLVEV